MRGQHGPTRGQHGPKRGHNGQMRGSYGQMRGHPNSMRGQEGLRRGSRGAYSGQPMKSRAPNEESVENEDSFDHNGRPFRQQAHGNQFGQPRGQPRGNEFAQPHGQEYCDAFGEPQGQQLGNQFGQPHGNQFGQPHRNQFGQPDGYPVGQPHQFGQPHGQPHGNQVGQPHDQPHGYQLGEPGDYFRGVPHQQQFGQPQGPQPGHPAGRHVGQKPPRLENEEQIDVNDSNALGKVISRELQKLMNGEDSDENETQNSIHESYLAQSNNKERSYFLQICDRNVRMYRKFDTSFSNFGHFLNEFITYFFLGYLQNIGKSTLDIALQYIVNDEGLANMIQQ